MAVLIEQQPGFGKCDHGCLLFDLKCSKYISKYTTITYNFYWGEITQIAKTN